MVMQLVSMYNEPVGTIKIWSGTVATIPTGWQLCDGTNGTRDLRNRFVLGTTNTAVHPVGETGGYDEQFEIAADDFESMSTDNVSGPDVVLYNNTAVEVSYPHFYVLAYIQKV